MSVVEILEELPQLSTEDQNIIREFLYELTVPKFEETDEILAAIDEGIHSAETETSLSVEQVRAELSLWFTKSS